MSIVAAGVVPHPPALLPGVTGRPIAEIEEIRMRAAAAVQWVFDAEPDLVVAVSGGVPTGDHTDDGVASAGYLGMPAARGTSLGLHVIAALAPEKPAAPVEWHSVADTATADAATALGAEIAERAPRIGLLVAGDGSARRGLKAPGHLDERAAPFDAGVERALATGDVEALRRLDPDLAAELLVAGRSGWQVLAGSVGNRSVDAHLDYSGDPFGVWYAVARWTVG